MITNHRAFFIEETPQLVMNLTPDSKPLWGNMDALEMIKHLYGSAVLMQTRGDNLLVIPEEKVPMAQAFLRSEKPLMKNAPKPEVYRVIEQSDFGGFKQSVAAFIGAIRQFEEHTRTTPDFTFFHPYFGLLDAELTRQLQFKHITHHFHQFRLIEN